MRLVLPMSLALILTPMWVPAPAASQDSARVVTFHKDVLPVLQRNCQSCHRPGQIGPFSMLTYKDTRPWAKAIKLAVVSKAMPPWFADPRYGHFNNDRSLKQDETDTIVGWVDSGAPEGDPKDAPPPVEWPEGGWQIKPDVTFDLPPYPVPATRNQGMGAHGVSSPVQGRHLGHISRDSARRAGSGASHVLWFPEASTDNSVQPLRVDGSTAG